MREIHLELTDGALDDVLAHTRAAVATLRQALNEQLAVLRALEDERERRLAEGDARRDAEFDDDDHDDDPEG